MWVSTSDNFIFIFWIFSLFQDRHCYVKLHGRKEKSILSCGGIRFNSYPPVHGQYDNGILGDTINENGGDGCDNNDNNEK